MATSLLPNAKCVPDLDRTYQPDELDELGALIAALNGEPLRSYETATLKRWKRDGVSARLRKMPEERFTCWQADAPATPGPAYFNGKRMSAGEAMLMFAAATGIPVNSRRRGCVVQGSRQSHGRPIRARGSRRVTTRSCARSGDSGDSGEGEPGPTGFGRSQLELNIGCADQTAHKDISICWHCGWSRVDGPLPWEAGR